MAHHPPTQLGASRVPMMDRAMLDARTRPLEQEPVPIWLRHRLQRRHMREANLPRRRAREWMGRLTGRPRD